MSRDAAARARRNHGLRLAFAVILGLSIEIFRGAFLPPLAAVIALQLLAAPGPAPTPKVVVALLGIMSASSLFAYGVAALTVGNTFLYALGVGLIYLWGFFAAVRPGTALAGTMFLTMSIVVTSLSAVSTGLASFIVIELLISVVVGIGVVFIAHAVFPYTAPGRPAAAPVSSAASTAFPAGRYAIAATLIILPLHLVLTADGIAAMVILLTVTTMLRQRGVAQSVRYAVNYAFGNLLGGALAWVAALVVSLHETTSVLVTVTATCALFMAWQLERSPTRAGILLPGYVTFILLFGLAFGPLALEADVAFLLRVGQVVLAALYAICAISLLLPVIVSRKLADSYAAG